MYTFSPQKAYLFDIDGVLTNPQAKKVQQEEIFTQLIERLQAGYPIGLNTGRAIDFISQHVLRPLEIRVPDKKLLKNIFVSGEKGAIRIMYNDYGEKTIFINHDMSVPEKIQHEVKQLAANPAYSDIVFYDETKQTMITLELQHNKTLDEFNEPKKELLNLLQQLLIQHHIQNDFYLDPTRISIDIQNNRVGKALGANLFSQWLDEKSMQPEEYICFGDSPSDIDMYNEFKKLKKEVLFVFVGGKDQLQIASTNREILVTRSLFDKGTLAFLQNEE